jgi:hypothetical protein
MQQEVTEMRTRAKHALQPKSASCISGTNASEGHNRKAFATSTPPKSNSCPKVALLGPRRKSKILVPTRSMRSHAWDGIGGRCAAASTRRPSERWLGSSRIDCWGCQRFWISRWTARRLAWLLSGRLSGRGANGRARQTWREYCLDQHFVIACLST